MSVEPRMNQIGNINNTITTNAITTGNNNKKPEWKIFFDLQCQFSRTVRLEKLDAIKKRFGNEYTITTHITSLAFHRSAFLAHTAAYMVGLHGGALHD